MAHWFKNAGRLRRMVATLGVTACVTVGVALGQYSNQYQNNLNPDLNWRAPVIHGQTSVPSQPTSKTSANPSQVQLVQHLEPTQPAALLPTVNTIDSSQSPTPAAPPPINGTRVAQVPGIGGSRDAQMDTMYPERRPGTVGHPASAGVTAPVPGVPRDNSYSRLGGDDFTTPSPGTRRILECGDPHEIGAPMSELSVIIDIDINWSQLDPCSINVDDYYARNWPRTCVQYNASNLCTSAAYFEDPAVERYGHSWGPFMQPVMSAAHFYGSVLFLPYKMGLTPPCECVYTIGYYRPGSCAPYMIDPIPLSIRAGLAQAGAVVGLAYAIP